MNDEEKVTYFAQTDSRNQRVKFGIKQKDRSRHLYVIGKTGMGKSTLLENLAIQDIKDGNGIAFIDPHGKTADLLLEYIPKERMNDVIYFAPFDMEYPISFNVMEDVGPERRHLVANGLMSAFKKIWVDAWSARMEYILGNIMLALLEYPGSTLIGVNRMLVDKDYRKKIVDNITDPSVRSFWVDEYAKYTDKFAAEAAPAIQNKVGQFVANPLVRNIIGQPKSSFDLRKVMDEKKILIINLSKGRVGEANANLLGSMLITKIYLAAMSRADLKEKELKAAPHFYLYVDEFQSFANESFADILSEARKYKLDLTIAHQYIEQMSEEVRAAVFGNVGTMIAFRVGAYDAEVLEKEFAPQFTAEDIVNLQKYQMYLKLMIDEVTSPPFSATGLPPFPKPEGNIVQDIISASRKSFARPRYEVEDEIRKWHEELAGGDSGAKKQSTGPRDQGAGQMRSSSGNQSGRSGFSSAQGGGSQSGQGGQYNQQGGSSNKSFGNSAGGQGQAFSQSRDGQQGQQRDQRPFQNASAPQQNPPQNSQNQSSGGQKVSPKEKENREAELRKAISLSYLKNDQEVKNDQKNAKPENVAALREALLSVMKEANMTSPGAQPQASSGAQASSTSSAVALQSPQGQNQPNKGPNSASEPKSQPLSAQPAQPQNKPQNPVEQAQKPQSQASQSPSTESQTQPKAPAPEAPAAQPKTESNSSESKQQQAHHSKDSFEQTAANQAKRFEYKRPNPAEVPEEILKKILNVNE